MAEIEPAVADLHRRVGGLEVLVQGHGKALEALQTGFVEMKDSLGELKGDVRSQSDGMAAIMQKLEFVDKLEDMAMQTQLVVKLIKVLIGVVASAAFLYLAFVQKDFNMFFKVMGTLAGVQ